MKKDLYYQMQQGKWDYKSRWNEFKLKYELVCRRNLHQRLNL